MKKQESTYCDGGGDGGDNDGDNGEECEQKVKFEHGFQWLSRKSKNTFIRWDINKLLFSDGNRRC